MSMYKYKNRKRPFSFLFSFALFSCVFCAKGGFEAAYYMYSGHCIRMKVYTYAWQHLRICWTVRNTVVGVVVLLLLDRKSCSVSSHYPSECLTQSESTPCRFQLQTSRFLSETNKQTFRNSNLSFLSSINHFYVQTEHCFREKGIHCTRSWKEKSFPPGFEPLIHGLRDDLSIPLIWWLGIKF